VLILFYRKEARVCQLLYVTAVSGITNVPAITANVPTSLGKMVAMTLNGKRQLKGLHNLLLTQIEWVITLARKNLGGNGYSREKRRCINLTG